MSGRSVSSDRDEAAHHGFFRAALRARPASSLANRSSSPATSIWFLRMPRCCASALSASSLFQNLILRTMSVTPSPAAAFLTTASKFERGGGLLRGQVGDGLQPLDGDRRRDAEGDGDDRLFLPEAARVEERDPAVLLEDALLGDGGGFQVDGLAGGHGHSSARVSPNGSKPALERARAHGARLGRPKASVPSNASRRSATCLWRPAPGSSASRGRRSGAGWSSNRRRRPRATRARSSLAKLGGFRKTGVFGTPIRDLPTPQALTSLRGGVDLLAKHAIPSGRNLARRSI
jgi:hypothetical protein